MLQLMHLPLDAYESQKALQTEFAMENDWECGEGRRSCCKKILGGLRAALRRRTWGCWLTWSSTWPMHSESRKPNTSWAHPSPWAAGKGGDSAPCSTLVRPHLKMHPALWPPAQEGHVPKLSLAAWFRHSALIMFWRELNIQELETGFAIPLLSNLSVCWLAQWSRLSISHFSVSLWFIFISFPELFIFKKRGLFIFKLRSKVESMSKAMYKVHGQPMNKNTYLNLHSQSVKLCFLPILAST